MGQAGNEFCTQDLCLLDVRVEETDKKPDAFNGRICVSDSDQQLREDDNLEYSMFKCILLRSIEHLRGEPPLAG